MKLLLEICSWNEFMKGKLSVHDKIYIVPEVKNNLKFCNTVYKQK